MAGLQSFTVKITIIFYSVGYIYCTYISDARMGVISAGLVGRVIKNCILIMDKINH